MARDAQDRRQDGMNASILQSRPFGLRVMARGTLAPMSLLLAVRTAIRGVEPDAALAEILTLSDTVYLRLFSVEARREWVEPDLSPLGLERLFGAIASAAQE